MPGATVIDDAERRVTRDGGGSGGKLPPGGRGGGDDDRDNPHRDATPLRKIYSIALGVGLASILMFFLALASAFVVLKISNPNWVPAHLPRLVWVNTVVLLSSSAALERARGRLRAANIAEFRKLWTVATVLGLMFLGGQLIVWRQLIAQGLFVAKNQATSFFYIFTGAHGVHLLGGVCALLYVALHKFDDRRAPLSTAAQLAAVYWHFMDGMWIFLLALLYLSK
jgi:cytochrome c oxidase subunit 3